MNRTILLLALVVGACTSGPPPPPYEPADDALRFTGEVHLRNVEQLTFGGNNAEAYWSFDDERLIFQSDWERINPHGCDQQFVMNLNLRETYQLMSTGHGRTTCGFFLKDGRMIYASTHGTDSACPTPPASQGRYRWPIYDSYEIYVANSDGTNPEVLIGGEGYDAEATASPNGRYIVFTSMRSGDLELWRYTIANGELLQLTNTPGYDGGAFFSWDSRRIVWRASRPEADELGTYQELLEQGLVEPGEMNIVVADIDGSNVRQVTNLPGANWAPSFHPDNDHIIFSSDFGSPEQRGRPVFSIYLVEIATGEMRKITHSGTFDAFPMFSFDGEKLAFSSNRRATRAFSQDTNVFIADWIEEPEAVDSSFVTHR